MMLVDRLIAGNTDTRRSRTAVTVSSRTTFLFSNAILHLVLLIPHSVFCLLPLHPPYSIKDQGFIEGSRQAVQLVILQYLQALALQYLQAFDLTLASSYGHKC